jgi:ABC-type multidrug transport system ATPase subunit
MARIQNQNQLLAKNIELLRAENIRLSVKGKTGLILDIKKLSVKKGSCIFIIGKNGAGKSSLLSFIGGYLHVPGAEISLNGNKLLPLNQRLVPGFEGMVLIKQEPELNPFLKVEEELDKMFRSFSISEKKEKLFKVVRSCRLMPILNSKIGAISGGEKRRLALAKALIIEPELVLLDEPFSDLDLESKQDFYLSILEANQTRKTSFVIVSHSGEDVGWLASEVWAIEAGKITEKMVKVKHSFLPQKASTARLLGWRNILPYAKLNKSPDAENINFKWIHIPFYAISSDNKKKVQLGAYTLINTFKVQGNQWFVYKNRDNSVLISTEGNSEEQIGNTYELFADEKEFVFLK